MQLFAKEVTKKVGELDKETRKTKKAFLDFLPKVIASDLKRTRVCMGIELLL